MVLERSWLFFIDCDWRKGRVLKCIDVGRFVNVVEEKWISFFFIVFVSLVKRLKLLVESDGEEGVLEVWEESMKCFLRELVSEIK